MRRDGELALAATRTWPVGRQTHLPRARRGRFRALSMGVMVLAIVALPASSRAVTAGDLDASFGVGGKVVGPSGAANAVAIQNDGKIVVAGSSANGMDFDITVMRFLPDGSLDTGTFGTNGTGGIVTTSFGRVNDDAHAVAIQSDGKIVVVGETCGNTVGSCDPVVVRYLPSGQLDTSFNPIDHSGKIVMDYYNGVDTSARAVALQPWDGRILVVGDLGIIRFNTDGSYDTDFPQYPLDFIANAVALDGYRHLIKVAGCNHFDTRFDFVVADVPADPDLISFGERRDSIGTGGCAYAVAVDSFGRTTAAGFAGPNGTDIALGLIRYKLDGSLDTNFGGGLGKEILQVSQASPEDDEVQGILMQAIAAADYLRPVIAGFTRKSTGKYAMFLWRLLEDGEADPHFSTYPQAAVTSLGTGNDFGSAIAMQADGKLVVAGQTAQPDGAHFGLVRYYGFICGNGLVEAAEECDQGAANGSSPSCCTVDCHFKTAGTVCRPSVGVCDLTDTCTGASGSCPADAPQPNGTACDNNTVCDGHETCQGGTCTAGTPLNCDDNNPCKNDSCNALTGCQHTNASNGTACDDATVCNGHETCLNGACQPGTALNCDDGNPCKSDSCNAVTGCQHTNVADNTPCDDTMVCNGHETCQGGFCRPGTPPNCDDGNACTNDFCTEPSGCQHSFLPNNTACDDSTVCNGHEVCIGGACQPGTPLNCLDGNVCTADTCDPVAACQHQAISFCDGSNSKEGLVGGSNNTCTGGTLDASNNCILQTGNVKVTIPPGALPNPTPINVIGLVPGSPCQSVIDLQGTSSHVVSCMELLPSAPALFTQPVTLQFGWTNHAPSTCAVASPGNPDLNEGTIQVYRNGAAVTQRCDPNHVCPGSPVSAGCTDASFCSTASCDPGANTFTLTGVTHFSEYALTTLPCAPVAAASMTLKKLVPPPGDDQLSVKGTFTLPAGVTLSDVDPTVHGLEMVLGDPTGTIADALLAAGAFDGTSGWKENGSGTKFNYLNKTATPPGGITKASVQDRSSKVPGQVAVRFKGRNGTYAFGSVPVTDDVVLPDAGLCFRGSFDGSSCVSTSSGSVLRCK